MTRIAAILDLRAHCSDECPNIVRESWRKEARFRKPALSADAR